MAELLGDVAQRIAEQTTAYEVKELNKNGENRTYVDFNAGQFGLDWGSVNLGGWRPIAVENTEDDIYRVWFQQR